MEGLYHEKLFEQDDVDHIIRLDDIQDAMASDYFDEFDRKKHYDRMLAEKFNLSTEERSLPTGSSERRKICVMIGNKCRCQSAPYVIDPPVNSSVRETTYLTSVVPFFFLAIFVYYCFKM